jgi:signal peptidase I
MEEPVIVQPDDTEELGGAEEPSRRERILFLLREVVETLLLAAIIYGVVNLTTVRRVVQGPSMEPTLWTGQFLIVSRLAYWFGEPQRGDIIVFHPTDSNYFFSPEDIVKRIIGLPGETVSIENGQISIDGQLLDEPYIRTPAQYDGTWVVPEGQYFVLGDNRNNSQDSHSWGPLDGERIIGPVWLSYWPPSRWGTVAHYHDYALEP